jgi:hypothetical protein
MSFFGTVHLKSKQTPTRVLVAAAAFVLLSICAPSAWALDIEGVQNGGLDVPKVVAVVQRPGEDGPIEYEGDIAAIIAYLDTGSSGMIIKPSYVPLLGLNTEPGVQFLDVGVGGVDSFEVSEELIIKVGSNPFTDPDQLSSYNHDVGPLRTQIGPDGFVDPLFDDPYNIFGMPVMIGKVTVIDPKPLNALLLGDLDNAGFASTFLYDPGTPFNPVAPVTDPGIPHTSYHVQMSYGEFGRFTQTVPDGSPTVDLAHNPFIGPNPVLQLEENPPVDATPPVRISYGGLEAEGSFLFDTGAQASFISSILAEQLHVRINPDSALTDDPLLEMFDPLQPELPGVALENQFDLLIGGIGGQITAPGFFLDSLMLQTLEGSAAPDDANNINFVGAPVLIADIGLEDPLTGDFLILDGIFGMNFLMASQYIDGFEFGSGALGAFSWITFDEPNGILGLELINNPVPEPGSLALAVCGAALLATWGWRRRQLDRA